MGLFDRLFGPKKKPTPPQEDWEAELVWLPVGHPANPFQEEVLDCRRVALSFTSTTSKAAIAESFSRLRASDGRETRNQLPEEALVTDCELRIPSEGRHPEGPLFVAREMEDKWDFYVYDQRLYLRRSWTGQLLHVAELEYSSDAVTIRRLHSHSPTVFGDRDFAMAQVNFLIASHLLGTLPPFPIPPDLPRTAAKSIALMGFSSYGRRAQFASYLKSAKPA